MDTPNDKPIDVTAEPVDTPPAPAQPQAEPINISPQEIIYLYELLINSSFVGKDAKFVTGLQDKLALVIQSQRAAQQG